MRGALLGVGPRACCTAGRHMPCRAPAELGSEGAEGRSTAAWGGSHVGVGVFELAPVHVVALHAVEHGLQLGERGAELAVHGQGNDLEKADLQSSQDA